MDFKEWIEVIELGLKIVAAVAAGIWAVFLLKALRRRELAQAELLEKDASIRDIEFKHKQATADYELRMRQADAQIKEIQHKTKQEAIVTVDLKPTVYRSPDGNGYIILAVVVLANHGTGETMIRWSGPAFFVRLVNFDAEGKPKYAGETKLEVMQTLNPTNQARSHIVRASGTESLTFVLRVPVAGLYLLSFRGPVDQQTRQEVGATLPGAWTGNVYVLVGDILPPGIPETPNVGSAVATQSSMEQVTI
jgi:hypothetical protein